MAPMSFVQGASADFGKVFRRSLETQVFENCEFSQYKDYRKFNSGSLTSQSLSTPTESKQGQRGSLLPLQLKRGFFSSSMRSPHIRQCRCLNTGINLYYPRRPERVVLLEQGLMVPKIVFTERNINI
ncbi:hypothetical protein TNCV_2679741 [Trichonephila clavipes]|nr:hypothetical protein TNCV_2679741 [Trichonephila clavipes]